MDYKLLGVAALRVILGGVGFIVGMWLMLMYPMLAVYVAIAIVFWFFIWMIYKDLVFKKKQKEFDEENRRRWERLKPRMPAK